MKDYYERDYTVLSSDTDAFQRLRLSRLFTLLQEAAIAHTTELGFGREKTLDKGPGRDDARLLPPLLPHRG